VTEFQDEDRMRKFVETIVTLAASAKEGHIPSSLSVLDLIYVTYRDLIGFCGANRDSAKIILSKGHASLALYAVLEEFGYINEQQLLSFGRANSILGGHPDKTKIKGVEASTGSLGHGLPIGVGMALSLRNKPTQIIVIVGDGELYEGTNWESFILIEQLSLLNIKVIIDMNQSMPNSTLAKTAKQKLESFGFEVIEINGHNHNEISEVLLKVSNRKPLAVIAHTTKGFRISQMQSDPSWHHRVPRQEELNEILREVRSS
jgi:transketolase